jgi:CheY-like chemotaxis protein
MTKIRIQEQFKSLPIIALTAKAMKDDQQKCIDAGANDYLPKPVDVDELLFRIESWL